MVTTAAFSEPWRVACPEGHVNLRPASGTETAYCEQCGQAYGLDVLVDRKEDIADTSRRRWE